MKRFVAFIVILAISLVVLSASADPAYVTAPSQETSVIWSQINYKYFFEMGDTLYRLVFVQRDNALALRKGPNKESAVIEWIPVGTPLLMINDRVPDGHGYCRVHTLEGIAGYAHSGSLKPDPPENLRLIPALVDVDSIKVDFEIPAGAVFVGDIIFDE